VETISTSIGTAHTGNHEDHEYDAFLARFQARFEALGGLPRFTTDATGLFDAYLASFPDHLRQYHNCHACRHFIERFGGLVTIDENGRTSPVMWHEDDAPEECKASIASLARIVRKAKVNGVFLSSEKVWGQPVTGVWHHLAIRPKNVFRHPIHTDGQAMAEKAEDFKNVSRALGEFPLSSLEQAVALLKSDALYRSEKVLGPAEWLRNLHVVRDASKANKANIVWRAVATAPAGFCHPRSSMIGTLLEDIASGMSFEVASKRFAEKMHPLQYQRPQAAPSEGTIAQAEKVIATLKAAGSLDRRIARVEELQTVWTPKAPKAEEPSGVFGHLKAKGKAETPTMTAPSMAITWDKFQRTVLSTADAIEYLVEGSSSFTAITTAVNPEAPPILQWDSEEQRNPFAWYLWHGGSAPSQWGLSRGWTKVNAISLKPSMWHGGNEHQGHGVVFILDGARESKQGGNALFPETLKSEFHGIRAVIEAYSRGALMQGLPEGSACGVLIDNGATGTFRVTANGIATSYRIDRWD